MHGGEDAVLASINQALGHVHQHVVHLLHTSRAEVQEGCGGHDGLVDVMLRPGPLQPSIPVACHRHIGLKLQADAKMQSNPLG